MRYLLTALLLLPALVSAQELHTFKNGEVADADKVNENFETIFTLAGGESGTITILTESVATAAPHPVTVQFEAPAGIFYWNVTDKNYYGNSDKHPIDQASSYTYEDSFSIPLGTGATISAHLLDMNGRPAVASKYVSAETAIVFGNYIWESGAEAPIFEESPVDAGGNPRCASNQLGDSEFFYGEFCYNGTCNCSEFNGEVGLPPPIDETGAIACIANGRWSMDRGGPLFSLSDLTFSTYNQNSSGGGSGVWRTTYSHTTYQFEPMPNPSVQVDRTDYCKLTIDEDTQIYTASASYTGTYVEN